MRIRVTRRDIEEGVQGNSFHCPVARAVSVPSGRMRFGFAKL